MCSCHIHEDYISVNGTLLRSQTISRLLATTQKMATVTESNTRAIVLLLYIVSGRPA